VEVARPRSGAGSWADARSSKAGWVSAAPRAGRPGRNRQQGAEDALAWCSDPKANPTVGMIIGDRRWRASLAGVLITVLVLHFFG
jgi:hypothetical protein